MSQQKSNVIDITQLLKKNSGRKHTEESPAPEVGKVPAIVDMVLRRKEQIQSERRDVRRTVLDHFIGAFVVLPQKGLQPATIFDISDAGMSFDFDLEIGRFKQGEVVNMRIYLSHELYFPFSVNITNIRATNDGAVRHGAIFEKGQPSAKVLENFVKFLEGVATISRRDEGDRLLGRVE